MIVKNVKMSENKVFKDNSEYGYFQNYKYLIIDTISLEMKES